MSGLLCAALARCAARRGRRGAHTARAWMEATSDSERANSASDSIAGLTEIPSIPVFMVSSQSAYNDVDKLRDAPARAVRKHGP